MWLVTLLGLVGEPLAAPTIQPVAVVTPADLADQKASYDRLIAAREAVEARYGKLADVPPGTPVHHTITTSFGKTVDVYRVTAEQLAFIAACDDVVGRAFDDPELKATVDKLRAAYLYTPAHIYFNFGEYEQARARFNAVITRFPASQEAQFAAGSLVQTYMNEGDLERVKSLIEELRPHGDCGPRCRPPVLTPEDQNSWINNANHLSEQGEHARAAAAFLAFLTRFPESNYLNLALYNAAN